MADKLDFIVLIDEAIECADACRNDALTQDENDAWTNVIGTLTQTKSMVESSPLTTVATEPDPTLSGLGTTNTNTSTDATTSVEDSSSASTSDPTPSDTDTTVYHGYNY